MFNDDPILLLWKRIRDLALPLFFVGVGLTIWLSEVITTPPPPGKKVHVTYWEKWTDFEGEAMRNVVNAYNASIATIATTTAYNPSTQVAAALNGDSLVRGASRDLRDQVSNQVSDLKSIGITIKKDGTLAMDDTAFDAGMASDPGPATRLFTGDASLAKGLGDTLDRLLDTGGQFEGRSDSLGRMTKALAKDRSALDRRMDQVQARYRAQFVALDGLVSKLQSTGSFLIQQLGLSG